MTVSLESITRPLRLRGAVEADFPLYAEWLNDPTIARALDVRPPVHAEQLRRSTLSCWDAYGEPRMERVRLSWLTDADDLPVGLGISYGWDRADDSIRELDLAVRPDAILPPWVALEGLVLSIDRAFRREKAMEVRCRTAEGRVLARLFAGVGAREVTRPIQIDAQRRVIERRVLYVVQSAAFYGSSAARGMLPSS